MAEYVEMQHEDVTAFMENPENQKTAIAIALQIRERFGRSWFKIRDLKRMAEGMETFEDFELPILRGYGLIKSKNGKHKVVLTALERLKEKSNG